MGEEEEDEGGRGRGGGCEGWEEEEEGEGGTVQEVRRDILPCACLLQCEQHFQFSHA